MYVFSGGGRFDGMMGERVERRLGHILIDQLTVSHRVDSVASDALDA